MKPFKDFFFVIKSIIIPLIVYLLGYTLLSYLILLFFLLIIISKLNKNINHPETHLFISSLFFFYVIPIYSNYFDLNIDYLWIIFYTIPFIYFLFFCFSRNKIILNEYQIKHSKLIINNDHYITFIYVILLTFSYLFKNHFFIFASIIIALNILQLEARLIQKMKIYNQLLYTFLLLIILFYILFKFWNFSGRLNILILTFPYFLLLVSYGKIKFNLFLYIIILPILVLVSQLPRLSSDNKLPSFFYDGSISHHLYLTEYIKNLDIYYFSHFYDQVILLFLSWFPRSLWQEKPIGIGYSSVDEIFSRFGYDDGYSQSIGYLGEIFYYFGSYYLIGISVVLFIFVILKLITIFFSYGYRTPIIIFNTNLIIYFWGGMASFSSRLWFMLIPLLFTIFFLRLFILNEKK